MYRGRCERARTGKRRSSVRRHARGALSLRAAGDAAAIATILPPTHVLRARKRYSMQMAGSVQPGKPAQVWMQLMQVLPQVSQVLGQLWPQEYGQVAKSVQRQVKVSHGYPSQLQ